MAIAGTNTSTSRNARTQAEVAMKKPPFIMILLFAVVLLQRDTS
jgi:hypothetical protein